MAPKIVDKEAKKHEILTAAMQVFAKKGVANTKMSDVAEAAGIGKGTIYEYYENKDDIFAEAFHHFMDVMENNMAKRLFKIQDPVKKLKEMIKSWVDAMKSHSFEFMEILMDFWAEGVRHKEKTTVFDLKKMYDEYRAMVAAILEDGISRGSIRKVNTKVMASIIIGSIDGMMLQWILDHDVFDLDEAADVLCKTIINGLKNE